MSSPFLRFEDGRIQLGGRNLMVSSASLSITPQLQQEKVYGDFDPSLLGAKTEFVQHSPVGFLQGQLEIKFYISAETFTVGGTPNNINRLFDIKDGMSDQPIHDNIVGRYEFDDMYLTSFAFSLSPFRNIIATARYSIFGTIRKYREARGRFSKNSVDFAHGLKSFGEVKISGVTSDAAVEDQFEISNLEYSINVNRKFHNHIRDNENTAVIQSASGSMPIRITVEEINSEMNIEANELIHNLNTYGDQQNTNSPYDIDDSEITAYLYGIDGSKIAKFSSVGKIYSQSVSINEGDYAKSRISVKGVVK
jgi:hypothetical protein